MNDEEYLRACGWTSGEIRSRSTSLAEAVEKQLAEDRARFAFVLHRTPLVAAERGETAAVAALGAIMEEHRPGVPAVTTPEDARRLFGEPMYEPGGAFLFGAHLGSFEILRTLARQRAVGRVCVAMYPENARQINAVLAAINPDAVSDIIALGELDSVFQIQERIEQGAMVAILADRAIKDDRMVPLPFLGGVANFPSGAFRLAVAMRQPVYFISGMYVGGGRYELRFELLSDGQTTSRDRQRVAEELMQKYVATLERHCRLAPYNWFNFYDFWETDRGDAV